MVEPETNNLVAFFNCVVFSVQLNVEGKYLKGARLV